MPGRGTGGPDGDHSSGRAPPPPFHQPSGAAIRAALAVVGVLDVQPEAVFDGLARLAAASCGAPRAEIRFRLRLSLIHI